MKQKKVFKISFQYAKLFYCCIYVYVCTTQANFRMVMKVILQTQEVITAPIFISPNNLRDNMRETLFFHYSYNLS